jgi:hypothetical protein
VFDLAVPPRNPRTPAGSGFQLFQLIALQRVGVSGFGRAHNHTPFLDIATE